MCVVVLTGVFSSSILCCQSINEMFRLINRVFPWHVGYVAVAIVANCKTTHPQWWKHGVTILNAPLPGVAANSRN